MLVSSSTQGVGVGSAETRRLGVGTWGWGGSLGILWGLVFLVGFGIGSLGLGLSMVDGCLWGAALCGEAGGAPGVSSGDLLLSYGT